MRYCTKCWYPDTKPDLFFNGEGVCNSCTAYEARKNIDWVQREKDFSDLSFIQRSKKKVYDCVVPVSGGKDSTYQVIKCLAYGMKPLAVCATTCHLSKLGRENLDNISILGVDLVEVTFNKQLRKKINKYTLQTIGDISWIEHVLIFTVPIREAMMRGIDLVVYGENPQNQYGGPEDAQNKAFMDSQWLSEYGGLNGLRVSDVRARFTDDSVHVLGRDFNLLSLGSFSKELAPKCIFLGHYFPWSGYQNYKTAKNHGFKTSWGKECYTLPYVEGSGIIYENLDNHQTGIHDYFKYLKFGFGRATDIANSYIKEGMYSRGIALSHIKMHDGKYPSTYLGKSLEEILSNIDMTIDEFNEIVNQFANKDLFTVGKNHNPIPKFKLE